MTKLIISLEACQSNQIQSFVDQLPDRIFSFCDNFDTLEGLRVIKEVSSKRDVLLDMKLSGTKSVIGRRICRITETYGPKMVSIEHINGLEIMRDSQNLSEGAEIVVSLIQPRLSDYDYFSVYGTYRTNKNMELLKEVERAGIEKVICSVGDLKGFSMLPQCDSIKRIVTDVWPEAYGTAGAMFSPRYSVTEAVSFGADYIMIDFLNIIPDNWVNTVHLVEKEIKEAINKKEA